MKLQESSFQDIHNILDHMARDRAKALAESQVEAKKRQAEADKRQIEVGKRQIEVDKRQAEHKKWQAEAEKQQIEYQTAYEERQKKFDKEMSELSDKINGLGNNSIATKEKLDKLFQTVSGIGNNLGDVAEDYFYSSISSTQNVNGIKYEYIDRNKTRQNKGEYDIVLINSERILVVEVKHKLHPNDITVFHEKRLPKFLEIFPEYKNYAIYGAVAGLTVPKLSIETANKLGLYVFTQSQDSDNMIILNPEGFEPKEI